MRNLKYDYKDKEIIQMIKDGMPIKFISQYYDIPYGAMNQHCKKLVNGYNNQQKMIIKYKKRGYHVATKEEFCSKLLMIQEIRKEMESL